MDDNILEIDNPETNLIESLEIISDLVVSGEVEEGSIIVEWQGKDIEILVRLPQD